LGAYEDSHHLDRVNFSHPWVSISAPKHNFVEDVHVQQSLFGSSDLLPLLSQGGLELKKKIVLMVNGVFNNAHPNLQLNFQHSKKPRHSNAKQGSTFTNQYVELLLHVT
jgi:hypothetical protein